jgi:hypothetical protein
MRSQWHRDESATLAESPRSNQPLMRTPQLSISTDFYNAIAQNYPLSAKPTFSLEIARNFFISALNEKFLSLITQRTETSI